MTIHTTGAVPDLFSEEVGSDPFSAYAELRALGPVYDEQNDLWLLTRHADVIHALHEPRIFSSAGGYSEFMSGRAGPGDASGRANALRFDDLMGSRVMIASDPPDHTLLRRVVSRPSRSGGSPSGSGWHKILPPICSMSRGAAALRRVDRLHEGHCNPAASHLDRRDPRNPR